MEEIHDNIVKYLKKNAIDNPEKTAFILADTNDSSEIKISYCELYNKIKTLANRLQLQSLNDSIAILIYDNTLEFIISFFACQYIGTIAIPIVLSKRNKITENFLKIIKDSEACIVLCSNYLAIKIERSLNLNNINNLTVIATDLNYPVIEDLCLSDISNNKISFIQYTSGSTSDPKGVVITHENLINNQRQIKHAFNCNEKSIIFSWLPFHHDMGLVGNIIQSIYVGCTCIIVSPLYFFQQPKRWLEAISKFKVTHSGGPNFAYDLCIKTMSNSDLTRIDLSSWKVAFNGSEYVKPETITQFSIVFKSCGFKKSVFFPCYGLAEATLLVSGLRNLQNPTIISINKETNFKSGSFIQLVEKNKNASIKIVSCGKVVQNLSVKIISNQSNIECKELQYGEICIFGKNVTERYWNKLEQMDFIELTGKRYLKTGDIGFFYNNELFILGRSKEMLTIRGRNHYPYEIEKFVSESNPELEPNGVIIFENPQQRNEFILAAELRRRFFNKTDLIRLNTSINRCITSNFGISPSDIIILKPRGIPRTTSGKLQRLLCKELYLKGDLENLSFENKTFSTVPLLQAKIRFLNEVIFQKDYQSIKNYLACLFALKLGSTDFEQFENLNFEFNEMGIDSLKMVEIINTINKDLNINLLFSEIFKVHTFDLLISHIEQILWLKYTKTRGKEITL